MAFDKFVSEENVRAIRGCFKQSEIMEEDVLVLLSTYNGERFIREQLDSVIAQKGVTTHILIRDDGSKDSTIKILEEYSAHPNISFFCGENIGAVASFNELMMRPELERYDYVAFCDQDDVWDEDKLFIAVKTIGKRQDIPILYCSNLMITDEWLNPIGKMRRPVKNYTNSMSLVQNIGTGCTQVFNRKAYEKYRLGVSSFMEMHDYWMTLLCIFLGMVIYDETPHIKYRQHNNNVVGVKKTSTVGAVKHIVNQEQTIRIRMLKDFIDVYKLTNDDEKTVQKVINYNNSLISRIKLLDYKYRGVSIKVTIGFKIRSLLGKMY